MYRLTLRQDAIRWLRERRAHVYVDLLTDAHAEQFYLSFLTSSGLAREQMREVFAETDTRLPPLERARLGARGSVFGSPKVRGLYELLMAEASPVTLKPGRFRSDEARMQVLARTAGILGELEVAVRRELGADQLPPETGAEHRIAPHGRWPGLPPDHRALPAWARSRAARASPPPSPG